MKSGTGAPGGASVPRLYALTDSDGTITAIATPTGQVIERYIYTPALDRYRRADVIASRRPEYDLLRPVLAVDPVSFAINDAGTGGHVGSYRWSMLYRGGRYDIAGDTFQLGTQEFDLFTNTWRDRDGAAISRLQSAQIRAEGQKYADRAALLTAAMDPHTWLDVIGTFDPTGIADVVNAAYYAVEGDWKNAGISIAGAALPYAGDALKATRLGKAVVGAARKFGDIASKATGVERKLTSRVLSAGLSGASGATVGAAGGAATGFVTGMISDGWSGAWDGALSGAEFGAIQGGVGGALRGFVNPYICFVAGTQVVIDVEDESIRDACKTQSSDTYSSAIGTALALDSTLAVATLRRYLTMPIEELVSRGGGEMGDGGGQSLLTRDQHDPTGPLVRRRIVRTYERIAYHLQVLTLRDEQGVEQTLRVTDEHPFHRVSDANWMPAKSLMPGEVVRGDRGLLTVLANVGEGHPNGIKVYNLEVEQAHTYFVLAERADSSTDAVWVHNANYTVDVAARTRLAKKQYGLSRGEHADIANARLWQATNRDEAFAASLQAMIGQRGMNRLANGRTPRGWVWHHATMDQASGQAGWMALVRDRDHRSLSSLFHPKGHGGYLEWAIPAGAPRT